MFPWIKLNVLFYSLELHLFESDCLLPSNPFFSSILYWAPFSKSAFIANEPPPPLTSCPPPPLKRFILLPRRKQREKPLKPLQIFRVNPQETFRGKYLCNSCNIQQQKNLQNCRTKIFFWIVREFKFDINLNFAPNLVFSNLIFNLNVTQNGVFYSYF